MTDRPSGARAAHPLAGWRVLVPRPAGSADELAELLRRAGAEPVCVPLNAIRPESGSVEMRRAVADLAASAFDWVAFTSAAAVSAVLDAARQAGLEQPVGGDTRVAAVGGPTAAALRAAGLTVHLVPDGAGSASTLIAAWPRESGGRAVLLPRSDRARPELPDALRHRGYRVTEVIAYRTITLPVPAETARALATGSLDAVLLTSPSTAAAVADVPVAPGVIVVAIGASTTAAARDAGLAVTATATQPSAPGLVEALAGAAVTDSSSRS